MKVSAKTKLKSTYSVCCGLMVTMAISTFFRESWQVRILVGSGTTASIGSRPAQLKLN